MAPNATKSTATLGAASEKNSVHFAVWAPTATSVDVTLEEQPEDLYPLQKSADGIFEGQHPRARTGSLYRYHVDGKGPFPDPASRFQPKGVHGPSQVVDPNPFDWSDQAWRGLSLKDLILYELHVGTFTSEGTFAGVMQKLPYLAELGVTAIELMPLADFAGARNWGYDGVSLFAPAHSYGSPDDLRRLVNRAHALGLGVMVDVVYNHLGPDGNYLGAFSPFYFTDHHKTSWGPAINLDRDHAEHVRDFLIQNALHWIQEYHADGLRLDAAHALADDSQRHFLAELSDRVKSSVPKRSIILIAEDCRNLAHIVKPESNGGWGMDAVWADDFHHQVRRSLAGDQEGYFQDFSGSLADLAKTIQDGWFFHGQISSHGNGPRGTDPAGIALERFVFCIQNHDQVGNRALGERLNHQLDLPTFRAATALLLTVPETPLLFMGQEWAASSPFLYFTDHPAELGKRVTEGRREEFKAFSAFADPASRERIPDPQAPETFQRSHLNWEELDRPPHRQIKRLYQRLLQWRKNKAETLKSARESFTVRALNENALGLEYVESGQKRFWILIQWKGSDQHRIEMPPYGAWSLILSTEDPDVCTDPTPSDIQTLDHQLIIKFQRPGALILKWKR